MKNTDEYEFTFGVEQDPKSNIQLLLRLLAGSNLGEDYFQDRSRPSWMVADELRDIVNHVCGEDPTST